ncbi:MAG: sulfotransferase [Flavobacteriales bacterium]
MSQPKVIFVSGSGRSGTNILKELLSLHSQIASLPFELRFFVDPRGVLDFYNTYSSYWTPYWSDYKIKELEKFLLSLSTKSEISQVDSELTPTPYADWELSKCIPGYDNYVHELIEKLTEFKYLGRWPGSEGGIRNNEMYFSAPHSKSELRNPIGTFLSQCYSAIQREMDYQWFIDDDTHSFLFAADLLDLMPQSKLIHMVRDPRDVVASLIQQRWAPSDIKHAAFWLVSVMSRWKSQREELKIGQFVEVKFEDLVQKRSETLTYLSDFIGFQIEKSLLSLDMSRHNIGRYKQDLSPEQIKIVEEVLADLLSEYGYV